MGPVLTTGADELVLTDDEVVAVAAGDGWVGDLPTVDVGRASEHHEAVWRGRRSLAVRGLVDPAPADALLLDVLRRDAVGARALLGLHIGGVVPTRDRATFVVDAYPGATGWLVDTVSDHGVHGFRRLDHEAVVALMVALAEGAHERGVTDGSPLARLWIGVVAEGRGPALRIGAGRATAIEVEHGRALPRTAREVTDLRAEVVRLADDVRRRAGFMPEVAGSS